MLRNEPCSYCNDTGRRMRWDGYRYTSFKCQCQTRGLSTVQKWSSRNALESLVHSTKGSPLGHPMLGMAIRACAPHWTPEEISKFSKVKLREVRRALEGQDTLAA